MTLKDFYSAIKQLREDLNIEEEIKKLGRLWKSSQEYISKDVLDSWDKLISEWAEDKTMPLIIRKSSCRGQEFVHKETGRKIIVSDNAFAVWVYRNVLEGKTYSLSEIKNKLMNNEIPMVYALSKADKEKAKYTTPLGKYAISKAKNKWKLCHIESVGIGNRTKKVDEIEDVVDCFKKYANPMNMFLLPKDIGGLGEIEDFIKGYCGDEGNTQEDIGDQAKI